MYVLANDKIINFEDKRVNILVIALDQNYHVQCSLAVSNLLITVSFPITAITPLSPGLAYERSKK